ncbi:unnamed protein product [Brassica oleracea var. botrytis]
MPQPHQPALKMCCNGTNSDPTRCVCPKQAAQAS